MEAQGCKLVAAIGFVVGALHRPERMLGTVRDLARRHVGYGVREGHYASVGAALLWTLEQGLGEGFTPETRDAWAAAYGPLSAVMVEARCPGRAGGGVARGPANRHPPAPGGWSPAGRSASLTASRPSPSARAWAVPRDAGEARCPPAGGPRAHP